MIHPPDVIGKYAPNAIIGALGEGKPKKTKKAKDKGPKKADAAPPASGHKAKNQKKYEENKKKRMDAWGKFNPEAQTACPSLTKWVGALGYMVLGFLKEIIFTIFGQKNITFTNDRLGLTRSAMFLFVFLIIHAVGNLHVFLGPDDFNGYGYFYVRLYWSGFGLEANIVEEYVALCALLHVIVALKRTYDIPINYTIASGKLNLAISGITLLSFMSIHLFQFRFGETQMFKLCPPPYLVNLGTLFHLRLNLFWMDEPNCPATVE